MTPETMSFIQKLPHSEKAELMEYIAMELSSDVDDKVIAELDRRHEEYLKDPSTAKTWDEVKARVFKKYGF